MRAEEPRNIKYICPKCNYRFSRRSDSEQRLRCPYCGSPNVAQDTFDINRMIDES